MLNKPASTLQNKAENNNVLFFVFEKRHKQMNIIPAKNKPVIAIFISLSSNSLSITGLHKFWIFLLFYHNDASHASIIVTFSIIYNGKCEKTAVCCIITSWTHSCFILYIN